MNQEIRFKTLWSWCLSAFVLAALTGLLFRWGMASGTSFGLRLENVRHAHSHLISFGWITPALMLCIWRYLYTGLHADNRAKPALHSFFFWNTCLSLLLGALSFPAFLGWGYGPVPIGTAHLPLGVIISGLSILTWYGFILGYFLITRNTTRTFPLLMFDGALVLLVLSSLGAWGLALGPRGPLFSWIPPKNLATWFLFIYKEGWCLMAVLGLLAARAKYLTIALPHLVVWLLLVVGTPLGVILVVPHRPAQDALWLGGLGGFIASAGLLLSLALILPHLKKYALFPTLCLMFKGLSLMTLVLIPNLNWVEQQPLRIAYLHLFMLCGVSAIVWLDVAALVPKERTLSGYLFQIGSALLVLSLFPLLSLWPFGPPGKQTYLIVFLAHLPLVVLVLHMAVRLATLPQHESRPCPCQGNAQKAVQ